jgi:hypothetical protein
MSPLLAYFLGILTLVVIFLPFWYLGRTNNKIGQVYKDYFCNNVSGSSVSV